MTYLTESEQLFIRQQVDNVKSRNMFNREFQSDEEILVEVTASYLKQREELKSLNGVESNNAAAKLARYEAVARGNRGDREIADREARLNEKINIALSGFKVGFGDIKRITQETTAEFEQQEQFDKMKF